MPTRHSEADRGSPTPPILPLEERVSWVLDWLKDHGTPATREGMVRYAIPSERAFGVPMRDIKALGARIGRDHELALAVWDTGWYEARMLTSFIADPAELTPAQMDRWCADIDNWAHADALCFNLFDRSPHAWAKVEAWSREEGEFQKRTAFALLWSLALHDKVAGDEPFLEGLRLIELAAGDDRNFVKKAVSMSLRAVGARNRRLGAAALALAERLAAQPPGSARWVGRDALRKLRAKAPR